MTPATNKQYTEYFLVHGDVTDLPTSGDLFGTGTSVNLSDGQLGVIWGRSYGGNSYGHFMLAGDTPSIDIAPVIKVVQGTENSADFSELYGWDQYEIPAFSATPEIRANTIQRVSSKVHGVATYSTLLVDGLGTPSSNTRYALNLKARSVRKDRTYGGNVDQWTVDYTTGDISGSTNAVGELIMGLGNKINLSSKQFNALPDFNTGTREVFALGIDISGGDGTTVGTAAVGDSIDVWSYDGTTYSITLTKEMLQTLTDTVAATNLTNTSTIEVISTAAPDTVDALLLIGMDQKKAKAHDDVYATKVRIEATMGDNITSTITRGASAKEDQGSGRNLRIWFNERAFGQSGNLQLAGYSDQLITPINYIDESKRYTTHIIDTYDKDVINNDHIHNQTRIWILMEATDDSGTATVADGITVTTKDTSALSDLNGVLGAWLLTNDSFEINGDSTTSTLFA